MPPNQSRSTGAARIAVSRVAGSVSSASRPSRARISGDSGIDFWLRGKMPPPFEISLLS